MSVLLDTHVWIWWLLPDSPLKPAERAALDAHAEAGELCLAAISMWEAQMLHSRQRLQLTMPFAQWLHRATDASMLDVLPLNREVVTALEGLPPAFHGDPADRIIVATARVHGLLLATHDRAIRRSRAAKLWRP